MKNDESGFVIDDNGKVLNFLGNDTDIVIPNSIDGITPTEINNKIFLYNKNITSIVMPDSITKIGESAFRGTNIESVVADGVTLLEDFCFEEGKNINEDGFFMGEIRRRVYKALRGDTILKTDAVIKNSVKKGKNRCQK